jgi:hypothetical protein
MTPSGIANKLRGECSYHTPIRVVLSTKKLSKGLLRLQHFRTDMSGRSAYQVERIIVETSDAPAPVGPYSQACYKIIFFRKFVTIAMCFPTFVLKKDLVLRIWTVKEPFLFGFGSYSLLFCCKY